MKISPQLTEQFEQDYVESLKALTTAGLPTPDSHELPSLRAEEAQFLEERSEQGICDRLVIAPYAGALSIDNICASLGVRLIEGNKWGDPVDSRVTRSADEHNRGKNKHGFVTGILLNDLEQNDEALPYPGLAFANGRSFERQKFLTKQERKAMNKQGLRVQSATLQELAVAQAVAPQQVAGANRLVHLPTPNIFMAAPGRGPGLLGMLVSLGGHPGAPELLNGTVYAGTSSVHKRDRKAGVRRVLELR